MISIIDAILSGLRKPCDCCDTIHYYKYERTSTRYSSILAKMFAQVICGTGKKYKVIRWTADCSSCGKLWLVYETKRSLIKSLKKIGKPYQKIDMVDSMRHGCKKQVDF